MVAFSKQMIKKESYRTMSSLAASSQFVQTHFQALSILIGVSSFAALAAGQFEKQSSKLERQSSEQRELQVQVAANQRELQVQVAANKEIAEVRAAAADAATKSNKETAEATAKSNKETAEATAKSNKEAAEARALVAEANMKYAALLNTLLYLRSKEYLIMREEELALTKKKL